MPTAYCLLLTTYYVAEVARARFAAACEFSTIAPSGSLRSSDWEDGCGAGCFAAPLRDAVGLRGKVAPFHL